MNAIVRCSEVQHKELCTNDFEKRKPHKNQCMDSKDDFNTKKILAWRKDFL